MNTKRKILYAGLLFLVIFVAVIAIVEIPPHMTARYDAVDLITTSLDEEAAADAELVKQVTHDLAHLKRSGLGITAEHMKRNPDGTILYSYYIDNEVTDHFTVQRNPNGDIVINIWEDAAHDELIFTWYGAWYLDGFKM